MNVTDVVIVNPIYRRYRKAITLLASIQRRADYIAKQEPLSEISLYRKNEVEIDLREYISRLDNNEIISPPKWVDWRTAQVMLYIFDKPPPGPAVLDDFEANLVAIMNEKGQRQRAATQAFYLQCALAEAHKNGWALLFNTLTVSPDNYNKVFDEKSTAFKDYVRCVGRMAAQAAGRHRDDLDHHQYFACVEEGGNTGRLHIHVLHMTSTLLTNTDPNIGLGAPTKREIPSLKQLWPYGWSSPIAIRYSNSDAYARAGWRWPFDPKTQRGIPARQVGAIGGYMTKYLLKAYTSQARSNYLWRVRKTRNLGRNLIDELVSSLTISTLTTISTVTTIRARMNRQTVPPQALRLACLRRLQSLQSSQTLFVSAKALEPQASLLQSARASIQKSAAYSQPNSGPLQTATTSAEAVSKAQAELDKAASYMDAAYFPYSAYPSTTLSSRHVPY